MYEILHAYELENKTFMVIQEQDFHVTKVLLK